ncbi:hypothetical protein OS493_013168 [Desmophyllum pertusum]|uniref:Uncharacterized protein n=1 Tax=Desmophyllum pertusum TaxID=174260 RepID=A0A9X0CMM1_9CNID|nr:hypothetical protein OS493_013168 [Desmophyllum pertusum]
MGVRKVVYFFLVGYPMKLNTTQALNYARDSTSNMVLWISRIPLSRSFVSSFNSIMKFSCSVFNYTWNSLLAKNCCRTWRRWTHRTVHLYLCIVSHMVFFVAVARFSQPWSLITSEPKGRTEAESASGLGPACKKYISVVSEGNYFIASKAPLPDRIELRGMCGTTGFGQNNRALSIPDLYRVKMKPIPEVVEDTVDAVRREEVQLESACPLHDHHDHSPRNGSLKEMYVSQYTHHFDPNEPRSHIAGWKVDIEPNGIPRCRSRMCVLNNPVVSGSRKRPERPKSAPPTLRAYEFDAFMENIEDDRLSCATLPNFHHGFPESTRSTDDLSSRLKDLIVDAPPAPECINDDSSFGYDPSDDMSESSSAFYLA